MNTYPLRSILSTFINKDGKQRLIFNPASIGGMSNNVIVLLLISFPFIEFFVIFKTNIYETYGIATSIVAYIIFLTFFMNIIFFVVWKTRRNVLKKIDKSWQHYFGNVDVNLVISKGHSPYNDFYKHYAEIIEKNPTDEELHKALATAFQTMESENADLMAAIKKDKQNNK